MSFYDIIEEYQGTDCDSLFDMPNEETIKRILCSESINENQFFALLSENADMHLEQMARIARKISLRNFGKAILLYTPIYLSDYCVNKCIYCGFNIGNEIERSKLTLDEVDQEARFIAETGLRHILILTGESRTMSPLSYIKSCINVLKKHFSSISIEIYPLTRDEYRELIEEGVDGLTIYQEVYDEKKYSEVHLAGPKTDYRFRLDAPERACRERMRHVCVGSLLGLADIRKEIFLTALHAKYLQDKYPHTEISVSLPRMRPHEGSFKDVVPVEDKDLVRAMLALRLFLPRVGIVISTREPKDFRDNLVPLGVTKMSAGSTTVVGGHTSGGRVENAQFDISDDRSVAEIRNMLTAKGYQAVLKDWWY